MSLPKCKDFTDYNKYPGEENPTTDAQMQEYMDNQNQLMKAASAMMWQPSTEYDVGYVVVSPAMPANTEAVCVTAGMTDSVLEPSWTTGNNIPDGSCFWKLRYVHYTSFLATEEDAVAGTDTEKIMTPATSKYAIEKLAGLPIGHEWWTANPNIPVGCLPLFGGTFSRTAYKDLWAWVQAQGSYLITEAEWQAKATANEGNVPFYSTGDGSTTFRVPSLSCWVKGANGVSEVGSYLKAGLPNIEGSFNAPNGRYTGGAEYFVTDGAFKLNGKAPQTGNGDGGGAGGNIGFDASLSNPIYGNSDTVQPPSVVGMWLVKAFGTVSNAGNQDIADISAGLTDIETRIENMPFTARATAVGGASETKPAVVVDTHRNGDTWYRIWSDGWKEQGGLISAKANTKTTITFIVPFNSTNYSVQLTGAYASNDDFIYTVPKRETASMQVNNSMETTHPILWRAEGY